MEDGKQKCVAAVGRPPQTSGDSVGGGLPSAATPSPAASQARPLKNDHTVGGVAQLLPQRHDLGPQLQQFFLVGVI